jgi:hypothetical protein
VTSPMKGEAGRGRGKAGVFMIFRSDATEGPSSDRITRRG